MSLIRGRDRSREGTIIDALVDLFGRYNTGTDGGQYKIFDSVPAYQVKDGVYTTIRDTVELEGSLIIEGRLYIE